MILYRKKNKQKDINLQKVPGNQENAQNKSEINKEKVHLLGKKQFLKQITIQLQNNLSSKVFKILQVEKDL